MKGKTEWEVGVYSTVLVPLDGSKRAEAILPHVEDLAQRYDATVVFVRVVQSVPTSVTAHEAYCAELHQEVERCTNEAESYLAAVQAAFCQKGIEARTHIAHGSPVEAIITVAEREGADLIAMASHGRSSLSRVFCGSVAAGVLHRIDRPLLLIRSLSDR